MGKKLKGKDLIDIGYPQNNTVNVALGQINRYRRKFSKQQNLDAAKEVIQHPELFERDPVWGKIAEALKKPVVLKRHKLLDKQVPNAIFGDAGIDSKAKYQMLTALKLPVSVQGAMMPDAHVGYGLPIGGVLATENAVIPYGVGLDIGCRMALSIYPIDVSHLRGKKDQFKQFLAAHTKFGKNEMHDKKYDHPVLDRSEFSEIPLLRGLKTKAYRQLGTSGSGNHFVEFGEVEILDPNNEWNLPVGNYIGLLSHSGSRGLGANIAKHYTYLATKQTPLPKQAQSLAWLDLDSHDGQEYWIAMNLAGDYAKACHDDIHKRMTKLLGTQPVALIENHHNFAWKQEVNGKTCVVHRKGATPAAKGELGIIPGSMTAPGFIVRGLGNEQSLQSASHGAGRKYSRKECHERFTKGAIKKQLKVKGVEVLGGGVDEAPGAYKDIREVMENQRDLVEVVGQFTPKIVRMDR